MDPRSDDGVPADVVEAFARQSETAYAGLPIHERIANEPDYLPRVVRAARGIPTRDRAADMTIDAMPPSAIAHNAGLQTRGSAPLEAAKTAVAAALLYLLVAALGAVLHRSGTYEALQDGCRSTGLSQNAGLWPLHYRERQFVCRGGTRWE